MKGFSMLEIILTIAVLGILLAITTNTYQVSHLKKNQDEIIQTINALLEEQKTLTQAGKNGKNFGIKFNQNDFILFTGTNYSASEQNKIIAINPQFEITETISNSDNIIYFSKIIGDANENATITISHITNRIPPKSIYIKKSGAISVIE
jgi:prepilin-type N-terminal cleavage/methylation domain-containing protein